MDHPQKAFPFFHTGAADPLVYIAVHVRPVRIARNEIRIVLDLRLQRMKLFILVRGYPGIKGNSQLQIIDGLSVVQLLAHFIEIHEAIPPTSF